MLVTMDTGNQSAPLSTYHMYRIPMFNRMQQKRLNDTAVPYFCCLAEGDEGSGQLTATQPGTLGRCLVPAQPMSARHAGVGRAIL